MRLRFLPLLFVAALLLHAGALESLNAMREATGLHPFRTESHLTDAARNHTHYMNTHQVSGHGEDPAKSGFTGKGPGNRAIHAGYPARYIIENVSAGQQSVEASIDDLMGAIYHRFGFLSLDVDEIGIGADTPYFTYDMGNVALRELCEAPEGDIPSHRYVTGVCLDADKKIDYQRFRDAFDHLHRDAPALILWPAPNTENVPTAFFEEHPDPLPDASVSGYPVSVEFNDAHFDEVPQVKHFTLEDANGAPVPILTLLSHGSDPNKELSGYQFALFPKKPLRWGNVYYADLLYRSGGSDIERRWCFATRSLDRYAQRVYHIAEDDDVTLETVAGKSYAVVVVPRNDDDRLGRVRYSYHRKPDFDYIDGTTFVVTMHGNPGEEATFSFSNGRTIRFVVSDHDTAESPVHATCPATDGMSEDTGDGESGNNGNNSNESDNGTGSGNQNDDASGSDTTNPGASQNPGTPSSSSIVRVQRSKGGTYEPINATGYTTTKNDSHITVSHGADGILRCRIEIHGRQTSVDVPADSAEARIAYEGDVNLTLSSGTSLHIGVDGKVVPYIPGALLPVEPLPFGSSVRIQNGTMEIRMPLPRKIRFEERQ